MRCRSEARRGDHSTGKIGQEPSLIPVSNSTLARLARYAIDRDRLLGRRPISSSSRQWQRPDDCSARYNFAQFASDRLRSEQQFQRHGRGPRIHDLRHTFAVRTIVTGIGPAKTRSREMIRLTTYLGHTSPPQLTGTSRRYRNCSIWRGPRHRESAGRWRHERRHLPA